MPDITPTTFVHTADLHLSPRSSSILKRDPDTGRLIRDLDRDTALVNAVDDVLTQDPLPSAFVIAGDIFDTYRGAPESFITMVGQIRRLVKAGIAVVGIAGNHDTPTNGLKTSMFEMLMNVFASEPLVTLAYDEVRHVTVGDIEYVLLPHKRCMDGSFVSEDIMPSPESRHSVLVVHGVAAGDPSLQQMDEAREVPIAKWILDMDWDYIAFGHYHKPGWVPGYVGKAAYCGSLENTVISGPDVCMERGPVYVDLTRDGVDMTDMHVQPIRGIVRLATIDVGRLGDAVTAEDVDKRIAEAIASNPVRDAIVMLKVINIARTTYKALPRRNFQQCDDTALLVRVTFDFATESHGANDNANDTDEDGQKPDNADISLHSLDREVKEAVDTLVGNGTISTSRKDDVLNELRTLLAG